MFADAPSEVVNMPPRGATANAIEELSGITEALSAIFATNPLTSPGRLATKAEAVGKSMEPVWPATTTLPLESKATARAESSLAPPRYVDHKIELADGFNLA